MRDEFQVVSCKFDEVTNGTGLMYCCSSASSMKPWEIKDTVFSENMEPEMFHLVGGLVAIFDFPINIGVSNHPN